MLNSLSTLCSTDFLSFFQRSTSWCILFSLLSIFLLPSFFKLIFSLEGNYNIVAFAIHQYELAMGAHVFPPS